MRVSTAAFVVYWLGVSVSAQTKGQPPPATPPDAKAAAGDIYSYAAEGRRDPFVNVLRSGSDAPVAVKRGDGAAGLTVDEVSVRGVMQSRGTLIAMVQGPDHKSYLVHPGDKLADGAVKAITAEGLVIVQVINDPLSPVKQREIRKPLRSVEDAKQ
jgi:Tfp pilus assembly protein PilP